MNNEDPAVTMWRATLDEQVHRVAVRHLDACEQYLAYKEDAWVRTPDDAAPEDPSFARYCGCSTCVVREVLTAAWVHVWQSAPKEARDYLQREWER